MRETWRSDWIWGRCAPGQAATTDLSWATLREAGLVEPSRDLIDRGRALRRKLVRPGPVLEGRVDVQAGRAVEAHLRAVGHHRLVVRGRQVSDATQLGDAAHHEDVR